MKSLKYIFSLTLFLASEFGYTQPKIKPSEYIAFQSGASVNTYNSFGARLFFEFQKDISKHWQHGFSFEQNIHLYRAATDHSNDLNSNISAFCYNHYYKIKIYKDRFFWTTGVGAGLMNVNWDSNNKIGPVVNASMTLNIRLSNRLFIETSPLIILLPSNRGYFSPINVSTYSNYSSASFFPFGIKIKL